MIQQVLNDVVLSYLALMLLLLTVKGAQLDSSIRFSEFDRQHYIWKRAR